MSLAQGLSSDHPAFHVAPVVLVADGVALVVQFLAAGQADLELGQPLFVDEQEGRDDGIAPFFHFGGQLPEFAGGEEEFAVALGLMVVVAAEIVFGDVHVDDEKLMPLEAAIRLGQAHLALPDRLDLGAGELDPRHVLLVDEVLEVGFFVLYGDLFFQKVGLNSVSRNFIVCAFNSS